MNKILDQREIVNFRIQRKVPLGASVSVCLLACFVAAKTNAITLPDPEFSQSVTADTFSGPQQDSSQTDGGLYVFSNSPPQAADTGTATGTTNISVVGPPSIQVAGHLSSARGLGTDQIGMTGGGSVGLNYYMEIASGVSGQIPINVFASTGVNLKGSVDSLQASATFTVINSNTHEVVLTMNTFDENGAYHSADVTGDWVNGFKGGTTINVVSALQTNTLYEVEMSAWASVGVYNPPPIYDTSTTVANAMAFVDPSFQLAAGYDPNVYHLMFSPGIQNVAPVPIPAAAWLLGSGVLSLITMRRRIAA